MEWWVMLIIWTVIFLGTLIFELTTADMNSIWFTLSALVCMVLAAFDVDYVIQIIVFIVVSIILLIATRPLTKKMMDREIVKTNSDKLVGEVGTITTAFKEDNIGEVRVDNQLWRAISRSGLEFAVNEKVNIDGISGNKLIVSKVNQSGNIEKL